MTLKTRLLFLSCLLAAAVAAHAQDFPSPNLTLYAGYNYTHTDSGLAMNGFDVSASVRGTNSVYLKGDFKSGFATTSGVSTHLLTGTVGPVYSFRAGKQVRPFAEVLAGVAEFAAAGNGENAFALQAGGGLDKSPLDCYCIFSSVIESSAGSPMTCSPKIRAQLSCLRNAIGSEKSYVATR